MQCQQLLSNILCPPNPERAFNIQENTMLFPVPTQMTDLVRNATIIWSFGPVALLKPQIYLRMRKSKNWVRKEELMLLKYKNQIIPCRNHSYILKRALPLGQSFSILEAIFTEVTWVLFWKLYVVLLSSLEYNCVLTVCQGKGKTTESVSSTQHTYCSADRCVSGIVIWAGTRQSRINKLNHITGCCNHLKKQMMP